LLLNFQFSAPKHAKDVELKKQPNERTNASTLRFDELRPVEY
jgi:hypothetical protein